MSEAEYLASIDTYWADKYFEEKEKMSETSKKKRQVSKKVKKRSPSKG